MSNFYCSMLWIINISIFIECATLILLAVTTATDPGVRSPWCGATSLSRALFGAVPVEVGRAHWEHTDPAVRTPFCGATSLSRAPFGAVPVGVDRAWSGKNFAIPSWLT